MNYPDRTRMLNSFRALRDTTYRVRRKESKLLWLCDFMWNGNRRLAMKDYDRIRNSEKFRKSVEEIRAKVSALMDTGLTKEEAYAKLEEEATGNAE